MLLWSTNLASLMFRHMHQGGVDRVGVRSGGCSQCIVVHAQWYASSSNPTSGLRAAALRCSCCERFFIYSGHYQSILLQSGALALGAPLVVFVSTTNEWPSRYPNVSRLVSFICQ